MTNQSSNMYQPGSESVTGPGHSDNNTEANQLLETMDRNILTVRKRNLIVLNALVNGTDEEYEDSFRHYKNALKVHLKLVSTELYVGIKSQVAGTSKSQWFDEFEGKTGELMDKLVKLFQQCEQSALSHKQWFARELGSIDKLIDKRFEEEKVLLFPFLLDEQK